MALALRGTATSPLQPSLSLTTTARSTSGASPTTTRPPRSTRTKAVTDHAAFTNVYAPTEVAYYPGLTVSKVLTGRSMDMGMFSFTITGKDATAENGTVAATADEANALLADSDKSFSNTQRRASGIAEDMAKLSDVVFNAENANKTYAFEVAEVIPANENQGSRRCLRQQHAQGGYLRHR